MSENVIKKNKFIYLAIVFLIAISTSIFIFFFLKQPLGPITTALQKKAGFPLYVPSPLPLGVKYKTNSVEISNGIVEYILSTNYGDIAVLEQAEPNNPPNFSSLTNFNKLNVPAGTAYIGTSSGRPVAVISTNTTLISMDIDTSVPGEVLTELSKSLVPVSY